MITKIEISPEVREFNEAVEQADFCLGYLFDQEPARVLLERLHQCKCCPASATALQIAMSKLAIVKR